MYSSRGRGGGHIACNPIGVAMRLSDPKGVSLVELLVALGIITIVVSLAFPSVQRSLDLLRLNAGVREVVSYVRAARQGAVLRNQRYRVTFSSATGYKIERLNDSTWVTARDCTSPTSSSPRCDLGNYGTALDEVDDAAPSFSISFEFRPSGTTNLTTKKTFEFDNPKGDRRTMEVTPAGHVRVVS